MNEKKNARAASAIGANQLKIPLKNSEIKQSKFGDSHLKDEIEMVSHPEKSPRSAKSPKAKSPKSKSPKSKVPSAGKSSFAVEAANANASAAANTSKAAKTGAPKDKNAKEAEAGDSLRSQKLMNAKDNNRKRVIGQFFTFALIFIAYFVIGFVLELLFL